MSRNINIGNGNYFENVEGNLTQGSENYSVIILEEESTRSGAYNCVKQIGCYFLEESISSSGAYERIISGPGYTSTYSVSSSGKTKRKTTNNTNPISGHLFTFIEQQCRRGSGSTKLTSSNNIFGSSNSTQVVQGSGNNVVQRANTNVGIGHMSGGHIADDVVITGSINQVVQGNNNNVRQSMFTNMKVDGDFTIGRDINQEQTHFNRDEVREMSDEIDRQLAELEQLESNKESLEDFWDESVTVNKDVREFADYIITKAATIDKVNTTGLLLAADDIVNVIKEQPSLMTLIKKNRLFKEVKGLLNQEMEFKLIKIVETII